MLKWRLLRIIAGRPRLFIAFGLAIASYFALLPVHPLGTRVVLAWDIGTAIFLVSSAQLFLQAEWDISADAAKQQEGEWSIFALTLLGAFMSFAAIFLFSDANDRKKHQDFYLVFVFATLALSWLMVNVTFAYRYAHEYYTKDPDQDKVDGGLDFPQDDNPDYLDFIYFAFVLGMTFQVSDVDITSKKFRRLATLHGLIGFLFNTTILALSVNIAASLL
jgi:uncharacterized membrane protein